MMAHGVFSHKWVICITTPLPKAQGPFQKCKNWGKSQRSRRTGVQLPFWTWRDHYTHDLTKALTEDNRWFLGKGDSVFLRVCPLVPSRLITLYAWTHTSECMGSTNRTQLVYLFLFCFILKYTKLRGDLEGVGLRIKVNVLNSQRPKNIMLKGITFRNNSQKV